MELILFGLSCKYFTGGWRFTKFCTSVICHPSTAWAPVCHHQPVKSWSNQYIYIIYEFIHPNSLRNHVLCSNVCQTNKIFSSLGSRSHFEYKSLPKFPHVFVRGSIVNRWQIQWERNLHYPRSLKWWICQMSVLYVQCVLFHAFLFLFFVWARQA